MQTTEHQPWLQSRIKQKQIDKYLVNGQDFIPDAEIEEKIRANRRPDAARVRDILAKSRAIQNLTPDETAALLGVEEIRVVTYQAEQSFFDRLLGARGPLPGLKSLLSAAGVPRRHYLWRP